MTTGERITVTAIECTHEFSAPNCTSSPACQTQEYVLLFDGVDRFVCETWRSRSDFGLHFESFESALSGLFVVCGKNKQTNKKKVYTMSFSTKTTSNQI